MRDNKKLFIPIIIFLAAIGIYNFSCIKYVFGYAYDTTQSKNCAGCHSIRKSKAKTGTWAIRSDVIRIVDSTEDFNYDRWSCDICHRDKRSNFGDLETASAKLPSAHPVPVKGMEKDKLLNDGKKVMYCTSCHDPLQVDRGVHSTYVSIFRLKFSGLDSSGVRHYDPDPVDDTVAVGVDSTSWFWENPFDTSDSTFKGFLKFGKINHYQTASGGVFDPKNARAGRELADFYRATETTNDDKLSQTQTIYFCITCHDSNGFPLDPMNTTLSVDDSTENRVRPPGFIGGGVSYNNSDGNKTKWTESDGGHVIQAESTKTGLNVGDRLPCIDCHDSHSSSSNRKLIKEGLAIGKGEDFFARDLCLACHNTGVSNRYYPSGAFTKYGETVATSMLPKEDTARVAGDPDLQNYHSQTYAKTCYGYVDESDKYGVYSGCHRDPHTPTMFCAGCHKDHFEAYGAMTRKSHPVGIDIDLFTKPVGDSLSINEYYHLYADTMEVPLFNNRIECLTCHNDHPKSGDSAFAPQMQGLLRGDAGIDITANLDSVKLGIGNNYKNHNSNQNTVLKNLALSSGQGITAGQFDSLRSMPELCINCHYRIIGVDNDHGGFDGGGFGMCDKCHSMHGQHSEPDSADIPIDSSNVIRPLHYGMYIAYDQLPSPSELAAAVKYQKVVVEWDTSGSHAIDTIDVYQDVGTGKKFSSQQNEHLLHEKLQEKLCERCHGNSNWPALVETSATQPPPPQIFFDSAGSREDTADVYFTTTQINILYKNKSTHPVDIKGRVVPGSGYSVATDLRCSSGTKYSGCHTPHGNDNYAQLNVMTAIGNTDNQSKSIYGIAEVLYTSAGTKAKYVSGMHEFCGLCHDRFAGNIKVDSVYTRHPVGPGVSLLNLYPAASERAQLGLDTAFISFFDSLILDYDTNDYPGGRPNFDSFLAVSDTSRTLIAQKNFIMSCITCHRQHGSNYLHLRKFNDRAVYECVNCHSKSPDILE
ncbi:MAG: hypothetical protein AB1498_07320 [bacterium]